MWCCTVSIRSNGRRATRRDKVLHIIDPFGAETRHRRHRRVKEAADCPHQSGHLIRWHDDAQGDAIFLGFDTTAAGAIDPN